MTDSKEVEESTLQEVENGGEGVPQEVTAATEVDDAEVASAGEIDDKAADHKVVNDRTAELEKEVEHLKQFNNEMIKKIESLLEEIQILQRNMDIASNTVRKYIGLYEKTEEEKKDIALDTTIGIAKGMFLLLDETSGVFNNLGKLQDTLPTNIVKGLQGCRKAMEKVLNKMGLQPLEPKVGEIFNGEEHDSYDSTRVDGMADGTIASVLRRGYKINDNIIRPALVVVNVVPSSHKEESTKESTT